MAITPLSELHYRLAWSTPELAALLGTTDSNLRNKLEDANGNHVRVEDMDPDGQAWVRFFGIRLPAYRSVNKSLMFFADEIRPLLAAGGQQVHPAGGDR